MEQIIAKAIKDSLQCTDIISITHLPPSFFNHFYIYETNIGKFFIKAAKPEWFACFEAEAKTLKSIDDTATVKVPIPRYYGTSGQGSFLIQDFINLKPHTVESQKLLGAQLAKMHQMRTSNPFGFEYSTALGGTIQQNGWTKSWTDFFIDYRLRFMLKQIETKYQDHKIRKLGADLCEDFPHFFKDIQVQPSLLHGDLWNGNTGIDDNGNPVIYDPASYYGHHEAELGIMKIFGGFTSDFFDAYHAHLPKEPGFDEREKCYQLYHYLNHYLLFGENYRPDCISILSDFQ